MSGADLFEDGFPHGTKAGYDRGCRSQGACPSKVETGQSCVDANMRFARSTEYRRLVASGAPVAELATPEAPLADRPAPKPKPASAIPTRILADTGELPAADYAIVPPASIPAAVVPAPKKPRPGKTIKHGTVTGYTDGKCRKSDADSCPSRIAGGPSCYDAYMAWYRAAREKKAALRTPTPTVTPEQADAAPTGSPAAAEEDTVNAAPEKTPELEATLARLREMHPPLNETCTSTYNGMRCRLSSSYIHVLHESRERVGLRNLWDNEHADKPATETPALAEDNTQPTTTPQPPHTVPADLRRDEDGDLQSTKPDTTVDVNNVTWDRTTADPWTGHELPTPTQETRRSPHDPVNHPQHYTAYKGLEIIDLTEQMNFNRGNAVKYIARAGLKNPDSEIEDLEKAAWYLQREIARIDSKDED